MSINTLRLIDDHIQNEIDELQGEIEALTQELHNKTDRLVTLQVVQRLAKIGATYVDRDGTKDSTEAAG